MVIVMTDSISENKKTSKMEGTGKSTGSRTVITHNYYHNAGTPPTINTGYNYYQPRKLYRSTTDKYLGGVCGGMGVHFNKDPVIIRVLWVILTLLSVGVGIVAYIIFWVVLDREPGTMREYRTEVTYDDDGVKHVHHHYARGNSTVR